MSLLRMFLNDPWREDDRPLRLLDQHFGDMLFREDMLSPLDRSIRPLMNSMYYRPWRSLASASDSGSTISSDKDKFQIALDVQQFSPEEISVKVAENMVTIEGKHEERKDEHGYISRQFTRKYNLPKDCDLDAIKSSLSSDGVLTIQAPKLNSIENKNQRSIPIEHTGPAKAVDDDKKK